MDRIVLQARTPTRGIISVKDGMLQCSMTVTVSARQKLQPNLTPMIRGRMGVFATMY
jgi:hypothetical protein